jgi:hypothetical protein
LGLAGNDLISPQKLQAPLIDIAIDTAALEPKLGLTVGSLKENMANGLVTSVAETGIDEDEGRTRLTFRYRARFWRVVISDDGTLIEDPMQFVKPKPKGDRVGLLEPAKGAL